jgi:hypothetical protein
MKFIKYAIITGLVATLSSCNDIFRDQPNDKLSEEPIFESELLLDEYTAGWYRNMDNGFYTLVSTIIKNLGEEYDPWYGDQLTVGRRDWYQSGYGDILKSSMSRITTRSNIVWENYYTQIRSINLLFQNESRLPSSIKNRLLGEAHFFRAWYYYRLLQRYGGVLLIKDVFDPLEDATTYPRASYDEMIAFISSEAEQAANLLDVSYSGDYVGRATRGAALMLKAKAFMWVAGEHFQNAEKSYLGFSGNRSSEMLDSAARAYDRVMALNQYSLVQINGTSRDEVVRGYRNIFLTKNSVESIWEVQHSDDGDFLYGFGHKLDRDASAPSFTGVNAAYNPTQNHVDEYRMANGKLITDATSGYDENNPYEGRDYRFYANILYDGSTWRGHTMDLHYTTVNGTAVAGADLTAYGTSTTASVSRTGYYMAKFLDENQSIDDNEQYGSSQNCILWRYAELLLDYAEIDFKKGRTAAALDKVNQIRRRVAMPELQSLTWDDIMNERRVELAFEKSTYWDLLRYNTAVEKMSGNTNPLYNVRIVYDADGNKIITHSVVNGRNTSVRYFRNMQYYWPIPWDDVRYHSIDQNPDWVEV